jgi:hypothetical protein
MITYPKNNIMKINFRNQKNISAGNLVISTMEVFRFWEIMKALFLS